MLNDPIRRTRHNLFVIAACMLVFAAGMLVVHLNQQRHQYTALAAAMGRSFFQAVEATRSWNMDHGGIYVSVTNEIKPNLLLQEPDRDLVTRDGTELTKINHAQMVRIFSELLNSEQGIKIHLTSLNPIRSNNAPDTWEKQALNRFAAKQQEFYEVTNGSHGKVFRYMAPLTAKESCLKCHSHNGYQAGDALGGLGVYFSYDVFNKVIQDNYRQFFLLAFLLLSSSLLVVFGAGKKLIGSIRMLQDSQAEIRRLEGMLPICAKCKKIRQEGTDPHDPQAWTALEEYLREHTDANFTHGLCPACAEEILAEIPKPAR